MKSAGLELEHWQQESGEAIFKRLIVGGGLGLESPAVGQSGGDGVKGHVGSDERQKREARQALHVGGVVVGIVCSFAYV